MVLWGVAAEAGEDDRSLSLSLGYARFKVPEHDPDGGALALDYERGLSEALALRASAGGGLYHDAGDPAYSAHAVAGITYALDVLKYVPYLPWPPARSWSPPTASTPR